MFINQTQQVIMYGIHLADFLPTSSAADLGHSGQLTGAGDTAGEWAQGILKFLTTKWLMIASTPAKISIPYTHYEKKA